MTIDKSWTSIKNRLSKEYLDGVKMFVSRAEAYVNEDGKVRCPCRKCLNLYWHNLRVVHNHLIDKGFQQSYRTWCYHGESFEPQQPEHVEVTEEDVGDEMLDVLADIIGPSTFETPCETVDDVSQVLRTSSVDRYDELFQEIETELYPGCTTFSSLTFLVKLLHLKVLNNWSNKSFDMLLKLLKEAFPNGTKLAGSYYEAKNLLRNLGLGYEAIDVCKFDCAIFWKETANMQNCPVCGESRWVDRNTKGKKVAHKVLRYFPLTPRLKRLYSSRHTAKDMRWHESECPNNEGVLRHPADGESWKDFDKKYPDFAQEPRNVRLGLATDGFNPYGNMSNSYSMWPVIMVPYNFPPWRCMKETNMIMSLLIPGPKAPGKDFDVFMRPLLDELKMLWEIGVDTYDAYTKSVFRMRAAITSSSHDYPAFQYISGWSTKGYKACYTCNEETPSMKIRSKIAYIGHRRFLPINETALRKSRQFNGEPDYREPPMQYTGEIILRQLEKLPEKISGKHKNFGGIKVARSPTELNWSKKSILYELPYWHNVLCRHNLDVMHIEKNVCDSLLGTLLSIDGKSKDTTKARLDLEDLNIRKELHIFKEGNRWKKPQAGYTLSQEERKIFVNFIKSVRFPDNFAANLSKNVSESDGKIHGLKSHDCHIIIQRLLPAAIRPFLNKETREALFELSKFFQQICARKLVVKDLEALQHQVVLLLCKLERIFPPAFFDIMVHLMLHLPREALLGGPVHTRWMYPFERMMKVYKQYVRNRARPEGSIAEGYIVNEALTFCSMYLKGIESKFCRPERHQDTGGNEPARQLSVFQHVGRPLGKKNVIMLDSELRLKAEWYVLNNSGPQMQKYLDEHMNLLRAKGGRNLDRKQEIEFPLWFRDKIGNLRSIGSSEATDELYALASQTLVNTYSYPGYIVNGVKFLTHERDIRRKTQNSGVYVEGPDGSRFYGVLEEVIELSYLFNNRVILFKCKWYDTNPRRKRIQEDNNFISVFVGGQWYQNDPYILASQAQQVFYIQDLTKGPDWRLVQKVNHRNLWDNPQAEVSSSTAIDTEHILQANNSSEFRIWVELPPLDNNTLNRHDVQPEIVENMEDFLREPILVEDDNFINDDEDEFDETLEEYDDDQSESSNKEDDSLSKDSTSDDIFSEDESH